MISFPEIGYTPANLRALLSSAGLTQQQAGKLLGVTTRTVAGWVVSVDERGHHDMPLRLWLQLMQTVATM
jgi:DNA-binding XRE family transcriptional regulator